ncbi:FecR family protein [Sphingomonas sp. GlSt437]|uniref:FecR family protein n=1 Tax=Sphingomonas sp. GlSt437 TaxID=3389970 RepID=UPI003A876CB5
MRVVFAKKGVRVMRTEQDTIIDQAINWHLRLSVAREEDWAHFADWLAADARHAAAYDKIALADHLVAQAQFPPSIALPGPANDNPSPRRWLWAAGVSCAAVALAAVVTPRWLSPTPNTYEIATRAGETRAVVLADGTQIDISGGSRVQLNRADPRSVVLRDGEATFAVRHDEAHPFVVKASSATLRDLGTVFNVREQHDRLAVEVANGSVGVEAGGKAVTLNAGDALAVDSLSGDIVRSTIAADLVGGWRTHLLSFDGQPLGDVAARINRLYAIDLVIPGSLSTRRLTGVVRLTGVADQDVPHLASLVGAKWRRDGRRWILVEAAPRHR